MLEICLRAFKVLQNFSPSLSIKTLRGFFILPFPVVTSHSMKETGIIEIMKGHRIIPDLIDEAPFDILEITYGNGVMANNGAELTPAQVKAEDQSLGEWLHWLVVNTPSEQLQKGEVLYKYQG